jgi:hypothetical protein
VRAIVDREFTNDKAVDFKSILTKLKSVNPDLIYYGGADSQAGADGQADEGRWACQGSAHGRRDGSYADVPVARWQCG